MELELAGKLIADIRKLEKKYSLSYSEICDFLEEKKKIEVPVSIFNNRLGSLESIVKFLKEDKNLSLQEISEITRRNIQPIRTTYNRSKKKFPKKLNSDSKEKIPLTILQNKKLSVLENLVYYLIQKGNSLEKVASILNRDYKTIWTIHNRIKIKT